MPVYLAHGFRWPREGYTGIRVHAIVHNLEDVAVEYIHNEPTVTALLENFRSLYSSQMEQLEDPKTGRTLHFLEQYDPDDETSEAAVSQPYAFVADRVITLAAKPGESRGETDTSRPASKESQTASSASGTTSTSTSATASPTPRYNPAALSLNLDEALTAGPGGTPQAWEALAELRDKIAEGEKIGWWVVYNGDPERTFEDDEEDDSEADEEHTGEALSEEAEQEGTRTPTQSTMVLGQPVPSLLPEGFKELVDSAESQRPKSPVENDNIGTAIPHPPPEKSSPKSDLTSEDKSAARQKASKSFVNPLSIRRKTSKSNIETQKEEIPEPPKLKEISKKEGFRQKFFGRSTDKK